VIGLHVIFIFGTANNTVVSTALKLFLSEPMSLEMDLLYFVNKVLINKL